MEEPYIKLLLLIIPAIFIVCKIALFPWLHAMGVKNNFLKKTLTVMVNIYNTNDQIIEKFITEGEIDKIDNYELIEIKRRTQTIFSIPYLPKKMLKSDKLTYNTDYYIRSI
jgi:hypothetical protein